MSRVYSDYEPEYFIQMYTYCNSLLQAYCTKVLEYGKVESVRANTSEN